VHGLCHAWQALPCVKALFCASPAFAVRQRTTKALCRATISLPCATAQQRAFAMRYRTTKPFNYTTVNLFPLRHHFMLPKCDIEAGKNTPHK
jgi:hypothetical protein